MLLRAACDAVLCAFFLKRDFRSWHAMVWITVVFGASNLVSNTLRTPQQFYAHASWAHPERMNPSSFWFSNGYRLGGTFLLTLSFLLLLLYTRRHFQQDGRTGQRRHSLGLCVREHWPHSNRSTGAKGPPELLPPTIGTSPLLSFTVALIRQSFMSGLALRRAPLKRVHLRSLEAGS